MFFLLNALWFVWEIKFILFWLYLWQLKDYHIGRFVDHFRTSKGRKAILGVSQISRVVLLILFFALPGFFDYLLVLLVMQYFVDFVLFVKGILTHSAKKPVPTFKIIFLIIICFGLIVPYLTWINSLNNQSQLIWLLLFDILTPIIVSFFVLLFQPIFVLSRRAILVSATKKLASIKAVSGLKVIAITGSYGKTSTKEFLTTILSKKYKVLQTNAHQNSEIGVAKCILDGLNSLHEIFIAEVGAYNKGKVKEVCNILKPKIGIVTGVNEQHLALFGSLENLLSAEGGGELALALPNDGMLVVNGDNKFCIDLFKKHNPTDSAFGNPHKKIYSLSNKIVDSDIWSDEPEVHKESISFIALDKTGNMAGFNVNVLGGQNIQNLLGAILIANELGMSFEQISEACKSIRPEQAGMVLFEGKHGINIIDSSYSSNPDGVMADLNYLSIFPQKKVVVMPCIIELGEKSAEIHAKIGEKIAKVCDLAIITSSDKFKEIKTAAMIAGMQDKNIILCDKSKDIYSIITLFCKSGDAVLLEGRVPGEVIKQLKK